MHGSHYSLTFGFCFGFLGGFFVLLRVLFLKPHEEMYSSKKISFHSTEAKSAECEAAEHLCQNTASCSVF